MLVFKSIIIVSSIQNQANPYFPNHAVDFWLGSNSSIPDGIFNRIRKEKDIFFDKSAWIILVHFEQLQDFAPLIVH